MPTQDWVCSDAYVGAGPCPPVAPSLRAKHRCKPMYFLRTLGLSILCSRMINCWTEMWSQLTKGWQIGGRIFFSLHSDLLCLGMLLRVRTSLGQIVNILSLFSSLSFHTTLLYNFPSFISQTFSGFPFIIFSQFLFLSFLSALPDT